MSKLPVPAMLIATALAGCSSGTGPSATFPSQPFSTMTSDSGALTIEVRTSPQPPTRGTVDAEFTITTTATGEPRDGLTLAIDPWMPVMNHGAIAAHVTQEGQGKYLA